jgi:hypothetical protein
VELQGLPIHAETSAKETAMTPEALQAAVLGLIAGAREKARGGLSVSEFGSLVVEVIRLAVAGLDTISTLDGPAKKLWAVGCVGTLFDAVADACVPALAWPFWFVLRPAVRSLVLAAAGGALEQILALTRAAAPAPETPPVTA